MLQGKQHSATRRKGIRIREIQQEELPGTMDDHVNHLEMVKRRHEHQVNLSLKKGRTSVDEFLPGDRVKQDNNSGKWLEEGTINLARRAEDQSI